MIKKLSQSERRTRRHERLRKRVEGTAQKPRLAVFRSQKHVYAQLIDDAASQTLASASSMEDIKLPEAPAEKPQQSEASGEKGKKPAPKEKAAAQPLKKPSLLAWAVGESIAKKALDKGITQVVFDRGGCRFHGRIKALAEGARKAGLQF